MSVFGCELVFLKMHIRSSAECHVSDKDIFESTPDSRRIKTQVFDRDKIVYLWIDFQYL